MRNQFVEISSWATLPKGHQLVPQAREDLKAPNPEYVALIKGGGVIPDGMPEEDTLYEETATSLHVPRAWAAQNLGGVQSMVDMRANNPVKFPDFKLSYRKGQEDFVKTLLRKIQRYSGSIGQAAPGFGKTICASAIMQTLGQRALITVYSEFLMDQWAERLVQCGFKSSHIGFVQQDRCEYGGKKLVTIAMIQTLLARRYDNEFYSSFGLMISDEVHRMGAATFRQTITMFNPKYRLGLSATPDRKDGCEDVFKFHIGKVGAIGVGEAVKPRVWRMFVYHDLPDEVYQSALQSRRMDHFRKRMRLMDNLVKIETYLTTDAERNRKIVRKLVQAVQKKRKVLLLTARLAHLELLRASLMKALANENLRANIGLFKGGMKEEERAVTFGCNVILGTSKMADEALDLPALDSLILACPKQGIVQPIGRILRALKGKKQPVVIDVVDKGIALCEGMARKRMEEYEGEGWEVTSHKDR